MDIVIASILVLVIAVIIIRVKLEVEPQEIFNSLFGLVHCVFSAIWQRCLKLFGGEKPKAK